MSPAKVTLSPKELELVNNSDWILTKNSIVGKVYALFGALSEEYGALLRNRFPEHSDIDLYSAKIAKGEQYEGLPWVMLDQPRHFTNTDTFAIRSFFWWGNFCSITLQLSGRFAETYSKKLEDYFAGGNTEGWHLCVNTGAWQHHFRPDNYRPIEPKEKLFLQGRPFLKLAKRTPLADWDALPGFFMAGYTDILEMLGSASPEAVS